MKAGAVWVGMAPPIVFAGVFTVAEWLRPGYSAPQLEVSARSLGSRGWLQILNFVLTGSLLVRFAMQITALWLRRDSATEKSESPQFEATRYVVHKTHGNVRLEER